MKKSLLAIVLLITGFTMAFAGSNQELDQGKKTPEEKSIEMKKRDPLDRLNSDLSSIPQNIKNCIFDASTIEQLESCHKQVDRM